MRRLTIFTAAALAAASIGCDTAANTNVARTNVAMNANSNLAVVVNNNSSMASNTGSITSGNTMTTTNYNVSRTDYDRDRTKYEAEKGASTIGQGANDSYIWFKTKGALATIAGVRDSTVNVDVDNGVITLKGSVGSAAEKTATINAAKGIEGQKGVNANQLTVNAGDSMTNQMTSGNTATSNANMKK